MDNSLIKRQDALNALGERPPVWTGSDYELGQRNQYDLDRLHLELVPSAQPEKEEIIRCKDCAYQVESWIGMKYCEAHGDHIGGDYDYCSNARRKENG